MTDEENKKDTDKSKVIICEKIEYVLGNSIDNYTSLDDDLKVAQIVQALAEAYKNLGGEEND